MTGGSSGLGLQIVETLARHGAKVVSVARSHDAHVCEHVEKMKQAGAAVRFVNGDITDAEDVTSMFDHAQSEFGTVTVLFNNAGVAGKHRAIEMSREVWRETMSVNVEAQFFVAQEAARRMITAKKAGSIVNISSILAQCALPGMAAYAISKAAVSQMTRVLALEWARHNIRVNAIAPGWFPTRMNEEFLLGPGGGFIRQQNPMKRFGAAGDLDGVVLLLASQASSYMTGSVITIDGGQELVS